MHIILHDPALLSSYVATYQGNTPEKCSKTVGIGVVDVDGLNYSADLVNQLNVNSVDYIRLLVCNAIESGYQVTLFTNGATEDEHYMTNVVVPYLRAQQIEFSIMSRVKSSVELVLGIKSFSVVIAYRLHASIIASSFNIPYFAVSWDNKVRSFFKAQNNEQNVYDNLLSLTDDFSFENIKSVANNNEDLNSLETKYCKYLFSEADNWS